MAIRDVMVKQPITLPPSATVTEAAQAMDRSSVGAVIIVDGERPVGIVTDRDLVVRGLARRILPDARVDSVMSLGVVAVDAHAELGRAAMLFATHPVRRLPVVDHDRVVGVITVDDLLVELTHQLTEVTSGVTAQLLFGHPEPALPIRP